MPDAQYRRFIRSPSGHKLLEIYTLENDPVQGITEERWRLTIIESQFDFPVIHYRNGKRVKGGETADWWSPPSNPQALCQTYASANILTLPTTRNVVTFLPYLKDGPLKLHMRSYVSPQGKPIGNPGMLTIHGGLMESDDIATELVREVLEELGIRVDFDHFQHVGDVYDADMGRTNHVFQLNDYDTRLIAFTSRHGIINVLLRSEGLGPLIFWQADLQAALAAEHLTPISAKILHTFPQLMPPLRPKAV